MKQLSLRALFNLWGTLPTSILLNPVICPFNFHLLATMQLLACSWYLNAVSFRRVIVNGPLISLLSPFNCSPDCPDEVFLCKITIFLTRLLARTLLTFPHVALHLLQYSFICSAFIQQLVWVIYSSHQIPLCLCFLVSFFSTIPVVFKHCSAVW